MKTILAALSAVVLLAGCQTTTSPTPVVQSPQATRLQPVSGAQGIQMLVNLCGASLPSFSNLSQKAKKYGAWSTNGKGLYLNRTYDIAYSVRTNGDRKSCTFSFASTDSRAKVVRALLQLGPKINLKSSGPSLGDVVAYSAGTRATSRLVIAALDPKPLKRGSLTYYAVVMAVGKKVQ